MINLAVSLPWWDSLDSVRKVHSDLEVAAIVCFSLLVAFDSAAHLLDKKNPDRARVVAGIGLIFFWLAVTAEIVGYKYGQRNDELSAQVIGSLDSQAKDASAKADELKTKADALEMRLDVALTKLDGIDTRIAAQGPRYKLLYGKTADKIIAELKPFALQKVEVRFSGSHSSDDEMMQVAMRLWYFLKTSGWSPSPAMSPTNMGGNGVWVDVNPNATENTRRAAKGLSKALHNSPLHVREDPIPSNDPQDTVVVIVLPQI